MIVVVVVVVVAAAAAVVAAVAVVVGCCCWCCWFLYNIHFTLGFVLLNHFEIPLSKITLESGIDSFIACFIDSSIESFPCC